MRKERGNSELFLLAVIIVIFIGVMIAWKLQMMADAFGLDLHAMFWTVVLFGILAVVGVWSIMQGKFRRFVCFLPLGIALSLLPALRFRCWEYLMPSHDGVLSLFTPDNLVSMREEPLWYGKFWVQALGLSALAVLGYFLDDSH